MTARTTVIFHRATCNRLDFIVIHVKLQPEMFSYSNRFSCFHFSTKNEQKQNKTTLFLKFANLFLIL